MVIGGRKSIDGGGSRQAGGIRGCRSRDGCRRRPRRGPAAARPTRAGRGAGAAPRASAAPASRAVPERTSSRRSTGFAGSVQCETRTRVRPPGPSSSSQTVVAGIRFARPPRPCSTTRWGGSSSSIVVSIQTDRRRGPTRKRAPAPTPEDSIRVRWKPVRKWSVNAGRRARSAIASNASSLGTSISISALTGPIAARVYSAGRNCVQSAAIPTVNPPHFGAGARYDRHKSEGERHLYQYPRNGDQKHRNRNGSRRRHLLLRRVRLPPVAARGGRPPPLPRLRRLILRPRLDLRVDAGARRDDRGVRRPARGRLARLAGRGAGDAGRPVAARSPGARAKDRSRSSRSRRAGRGSAGPPPPTSASTTRASPGDTR